MTENKLDKEGSVTSQKVKFSSKSLLKIFEYIGGTRGMKVTLWKRLVSALLFMVHGKGPNVTKSRKSRRNQAKIIQIESIKPWSKYCPTVSPVRAGSA